MKKHKFKRTIGLALVALAFVVKIFSDGGAFPDFFQGAFISLGLVFLVAGFIHERKKLRTFANS